MNHFLYFDIHETQFLTGVIMNHHVHIHSLSFSLYLLSWLYFSAPFYTELLMHPPQTEWFGVKQSCVPG